MADEQRRGASWLATWFAFLAWVMICIHGAHIGRRFTLLDAAVRRCVADSVMAPSGEDRNP